MHQFVVRALQVSATLLCICIAWHCVPILLSQLYRLILWTLRALMKLSCLAIAVYGLRHLLLKLMSRFETAESVLVNGKRTLVRASGNCFAAFQEALEAVEKNDADRAAIILQSVQKDSETLRSEARRVHQQLRRVEEQQETRVEHLTREINSLHGEEQELKQEENNLQAKIPALKANIEHHKQSQREAETRYRRAEREQEEAERKFEETRTWGWVPFYGTALVIRELIQDNRQRAADAERDKTRHERDVEHAKSEIRSTNDNIKQVHEGIKNVQEKVNNLGQERQKSHKALGESKKMSVVVLGVLSFAEDLINLIGEASLKTGYLERIMALAAKRNINLKRSRGIKKAVDSFEDSWMQIVDMMNCNRVIIRNDNMLT